MEVTMLPQTERNDDSKIADNMRVYAQLLGKEVHGENGAQFMAKFHEVMSPLVHNLSADLVKLLAGREDDLTMVAGTLKYIGSDLKILKVCADVAATTQGRGQDVGLECIVFIKAHYDALVSTRDALRLEASTAA